MKLKLFACGLAAAALSTTSHAALALHLTFDDATSAATILANQGGSGTITWGGTVGVVSTADGKFGNAVTLTSSSDVYSNQGGTILNTFLNSFTVSMHIRQIPGGTSDMARWQDFASFGDNNASVFKFQLNGSDSVSIFSDGTPGGGAVSFGVATPAVNDGEWHHVAMVSNGTTMQLYVNGEPRGSVAYAGDAATALDAIQLAGAYGAGRKQNVQLDDLGIWNEALSASQVK